MRRDHLKYLACPVCRSDLVLSTIRKANADRIEEADLHCSGCNQIFPIVRSIPRFVSAENYALNFGFEWLKHARTQYDSYWGSNLSEKRFFEETHWPRDLSGDCLLEVGSGSGRFTEQAASTGAMVVSMDFSQAVEANYASNGSKDNVLIVQADLYQMPFLLGSFDRVFCFGVLQHTPDVRKAFFELPRYLKPGGYLAMDVYPRHRWYKQALKTKYWVRPFTRKMELDRLYRLVNGYVNFMWPLSRLIARLPYGWQFNKFLLVMNYQGLHNLKEDAMKEWAVLDTFDMLSPAYDHPQKIGTVRQWFEEAQLQNIEVHYGYNGIEGRGRKRSNTNQ